MTKWFNFKRISLQQRLTFYTLLLTLLPVFIIAGIVFFQWAQDIRENVQQSEVDHVRSVKSNFELFLQRAETDIRYLTNSPAVQQLATAIKNDDARGVATSRQLVIEDFLNFITVSNISSQDESYPFYYQIRYLDSFGREYIRVERDYEVNSRAREVSNIQYDRASEEYFSNAIKLPADGESYFVSELRLAREPNGEFLRLDDGSLVPILHFSMPIYVDGELMGVIVTNLYFQTLFDLFSPLGEDAGVFLLNEDGYFLYNTFKPNLQFGFEPGIETVLFNMPDGTQAPGVPDANIATTGQFTDEQLEAILGSGTVVYSVTSEDGILVYYTRLSPPGADYSWIYASMRDASVLFSDVQQVTALVGVLVLGGVIFVAIATVFYASQITRPIVRLTERSIKMAQGELDVPEVETSYRDDEIGDLSRSFNTMSRQLRDLISTMESRVAARTNDLAVSAEIAASANQIRELDDLLNLTVNLIRDRFNFYYVQIYLVTDAWAELREGTGYVGRKLMEHAHRLLLDGHSLVTQAIMTQAPVVVQDTQTDPNFLPNELLPNTRSEIAIPLRTKDKVVAVLDIQHDTPNAFEPETVQLFQAMADQLAVTFENVSLLKSAEERALELETVAQVSIEVSTNLNTEELLFDVCDLVKERFKLYHAHIYLLDDEEKRLMLVAGAGEVGRRMVAMQRVISINNRHSLVANAARDRRGIIVNDVAMEIDFLPNPLLPETRAEMAVPMIVGGKLVGVLDIQADELNYFDEADLKIQSILAAQIAVSVENARSLQEVQARAIEMEVVAQVSAAATSILDIEELLWNVTNLTKERFGFYHAHIYLLDESGKRLVLRAGAGEAGRIMVAQRHAIPINVQASLVARVARNRQGVIVNNTAKEPGFLPNPLLPETRAEMAVPMIVGDKLVGVLDVQASAVNYFTEQDLSVQMTLAAQIAVAVENARTFREVQKQQALTRKRATEMEVVAEIGAQVASTLDPQALLWTVCNVTKERLNLYHAHIYLLDHENNRLVLTAGAGKIGQQMTERGYSINLTRKQSVVVRAALEKKTVISNDVTTEPAFLPNPLLPDTRSEMAVPIIVGTELLGVLDVQSDEVNYFTQDDIRTEEVLAYQIGVALVNARLYEETRRQAERERETAERLREVDRLKSQFLANMSHELRTPLNSIIGYSEVLLDGLDGELTEDALEDVEAIYNSGKHLLSIINEILDLAKIEAGEMKLDRKHVNLVESVAEVIKTGQVLVKDKPVVLEMVQEREIPLVYADPIRLRQILWNLVSNAVKFTESGSVRVHLNLTEDNMALITVRDTGIGMTEEGVSVIFQRFSQVDGSSTRRAGGTGLGLTITKQLVEMHDGVINVESEFGVGSTFWFTMPLVISESTAEEEQV
ncbi:MAG: GAF domain-containing protein [Chloroflexi bacterium]|nr:MAG: GAF domain-containing protein [Chloroflexota bacterium]